jgi:outer membrane protein assembly factor BamB
MFRLYLPILGLLLALSAQAADWPLFRGDPLQTGVSADKLPEQLAIRWKFETRDAIEGTPAIVGDVVYVGSFDGHLYALDLATGNLKWKYKAGPFKAAVGVRKGLVYAGDLDGVFHCLDAATGQKRWTYTTDGEILSGANFVGDAVLFGSGDEHLYCLSEAGKLLWKFQVPGGPVMATPTVVGDRTFVAGCDSMLHVIDTAKGKELGSVELDGQVGATAAVVGDNLYVGTMTNQLLAVDWKKVEVVWKFEAAKRPQPFFASAAVTEDLVIAGSRDKRIRALDRKTGREVWSYLTEGKVDSSPVVVGQRVFAGSQDNHLYMLDLKGMLLEKWDLGDAISGSPAVGGGCVVIGTEKGIVYCLGSK